MYPSGMKTETKTHHTLKKLVFNSPILKKMDKENSSNRRKVIKEGLLGIWKEEKNKRKSKSMDIYNRISFSWFYDSFNDETKIVTPYDIQDNCI